MMKIIHPIIAGIVTALVLVIGQVAEAQPPQANTSNPKARSAAAKPPLDQTSRLNILFILTDDLGWRDLSCYGSTFYETPNIDRLASQGMRFTDAYAAAGVCSPTRAAVLTGKTPARLHLTDFLSGLDYPHVALSPPDWTRWYLPHEEVTLAEMLKQVGYETFYFGKWHLGGEEHFPVTQGFDHSVAETQSGWPGAYFYPWPQVRNLTGEKGDYLTDRLTDEVIKSLERSHDRPFFTFLSYFTPHRPTQAKKEIIRKYQAKLSREQVQRNPVNAGMIHSLDENVGRIMQSLHELKLADNTLLIFTSDNGGNHYADIPQKTNNAPLRDGKGSAYEGAYRVPLIVRWPGNVPAGIVTSEPVSSIDFFPTLQAVTGQEGTAEQELDGVNLLPLLLKQQPLGRKALYWHYPHYHNGGASPHGVIRKGQYRLIEHFDGTKAELYDIENDIGETVNLVSSMPEKSKELMNELRRWRHEVGAQMPTLNPNYDPDRVHEWRFFIESKKRK
jgi:arylsulfatase A-like enzyme